MVYKQSLGQAIKFYANDAVCSMIGTSGNSKATPLITAITNGNINEILRTIDEGVCLDESDHKGITPLIYAIGQRHLLIFNHWLKGGSILEFDAQFDTDLVRFLLDSGADVNLATRYGTTPLMCAIVSGQISVIYALLERGVNINAKTDDGYIALHYAACVRGHYTEIVELLIKNGAGINAQTNEGYTALMQAVAGNVPHMALCLLQLGADPDLPDNFGNSPLHYAAEIAADTAEFGLIELLLEWEADPVKAQRTNPWDAIPHPKWHGYDRFIELLRIAV